mmetsp:Transcript_63480/g.174918  ORF Transcript_63480/g.174918 Transcript_63480/m.174918 type:complete len:291 (-) Transcript_63480:110-982(-)
MRASPTTSIDAAISRSPPSSSRHATTELGVDSVGLSSRFTRTTPPPGVRRALSTSQSSNLVASVSWTGTPPFPTKPSDPRTCAKIGLSITPVDTSNPLDSASEAQMATRTRAKPRPRYDGAISMPLNRLQPSSVCSRKMVPTLGGCLQTMGTLLSRNLSLNRPGDASMARATVIECVAVLCSAIGQCACFPLPSLTNAGVRTAGERSNVSAWMASRAAATSLHVPPIESATNASRAAPADDMASSTVRDSNGGGELGENASLGGTNTRANSREARYVYPTIMMGEVKPRY